jgi:hypothetical protein
MRKRCEDRVVDVVVDPHHVIDPALAIAERPIEQVLQRQIGEDRPRGLALDLRLSGKPRVAVAGFAVVRGPQKSLKPVEAEVATRYLQGVCLVGARRGDKDVRQRSQQRAHVAFRP